MDGATIKFEFCNGLPVKRLTTENPRSALTVCFCILFGYQDKNGNYIPPQVWLIVFYDLESVYCAVRTKTVLLLSFGSFSGAFAKLRKEFISFSVPVSPSVPSSVRPSALNNSASRGLNFIKFDV